MTKRTRLQLVTILALVLPVALMPSCARDQKLTSIAVSPTIVTFDSVGGKVQMRALGTFEHPPETKDVTNIVQWSTDVQGLATVSSTGLMVATSICGAGNVTATYNSPPGNPSGSVVVGSAAISGSGQGTSTCNSATLTVTINGLNTAKGLVTSSPAGISCPSTCNATFALGAIVVLTANSSGFGGWVGCDANNPANTCQVSLAGGSRTVTVTLN